MRVRICLAVSNIIYNNFSISVLNAYKQMLFKFTNAGSGTTAAPAPTSTSIFGGVSKPVSESQGLCPQQHF